jgi:hypothetical protein
MLSDPFQMGLYRSPYSVVPKSPTVDSRVPHQVGPGCPRRWRWRRRRPRRRGTPGSPARRTVRASRTLPVVAVIPVPVRDVVPARVPLITWAPVIVRRRGRRRLGNGASHSESGRGQPATRQHAGAEPNPRSRLLHDHDSRLFASAPAPMPGLPAPKFPANSVRC